ncbi:MAG: hypothetical protein E7386_08935 [Ruminococcaceae bacterium]|nr:hypothetical protein [Oscillospiraceae bacterium]
MYEKLSVWLDGVFDRSIPEEVVSVCFNLYEDGENSWSMEVVGCSSFDSEDPDWACDEVTDLDTRDEPFTWTEEAIWEKVLSDVTKLLYRYIQEGNASGFLNSLDGVAVGFADGDLNILVEKG